MQHVSIVIGSHYSAIQYNIILHAILQWLQWWNIFQIHKKSSYLLAELWMEKIDRDIAEVHWVTNMEISCHLWDQTMNNVYCVLFKTIPPNTNDALLRYVIRRLIHDFPKSWCRVIGCYEQCIAHKCTKQVKFASDLTVIKPHFAASKIREIWW